MAYKKKEKLPSEVKITIATTIPISIHRMAKKHDVKWNDALAFGIKWRIAEKTGVDFPYNPLSEKMKRIVEQLNAKCQECEALRIQLGGKEE